MTSPCWFCSEIVDVKGVLNSLLSLIGLHTKEQRAWAMYDWANSVVITIIVTAVYPVFFSEVACNSIPAEEATFRHTCATCIGLAAIAVLAPFLGTIADFKSVKKNMLGACMVLGVIAVALLFFISRGQWLLASILFICANIGASGSIVFYDSLLPHLARKEEIDRVSTAGFALGYIGGGLLLAAGLLLIQKPGWFGLPADDISLAPRLVFVAVAVWWLLFSLPLFLVVNEPPARLLSTEEQHMDTMRVAISRLSRTVHKIKRYRNAFLMLIAFLIYNDGIGTIVRVGVIYGKEKNIGSDILIASILLVQFISVPFALLFGGLAKQIGAKRSILLGLVIYSGITIFAFYLETGTDFLILAVMVAMVQGGTQALSRSLFGSMIPKYESGEFFGIYSIFSKFAGIFGPAIFALMLYLTESSRNAILSVTLFFIAGGILLLFVNAGEGQRIAQEADDSIRQ